MFTLPAAQIDAFDAARGAAGRAAVAEWRQRRGGRAPSPARRIWVRLLRALRSALMPVPRRAPSGAHAA